MKKLCALLNGIPIGQVLQDTRGRLKFVYEDIWRFAADAYPLSLSMPLGIKEHVHALIDAFLWGLLPDNPAVLEDWAREFQVSPRNAFALLSHVGEDCAGAIQLVQPERVDVLRTKAGGAIQWLDESAVAERLRILRRDPAASRLQQDSGRFSLAGAQPKTALLLENGQWGVPSGRIPTTHILKPAHGRLPDFIGNEHLCLQLAARLGFPTAASSIVRFGDELAIVLERFDRIHTEKGWLRVHQEDLCQALGIPPFRKYQSDGGPGPRNIADLLHARSSAPNDDVVTFVDALALSWLIAGTDGHAKNFGVLIGPGRVRLTPLYDIASVLPYPQFDLKQAKLAMKVADHYRLQDIRRSDWIKAAGQLKVDADSLVTRMRHMAEAIPDLAIEIASEMKRAGLASPILGRLTDQLAARAAWCLTRITR